MAVDIPALLGDDADTLLNHVCQGIPHEDLHLPGPDFVDRVWRDSDRNPQVLRNLQSLFDHGRLAGTGYVSILPVDQGIEHSAAASFAPNPIYFDPANIVELAIEGGCNAVAIDLRRARRGGPALRPPDPLHRQAQPQRAAHLPEQVRPDHVRLGASRPANLGAAGVGATIYFGSDEVDPPDPGGERGFRSTPTSSGMFTVLWCYLRNPAFKKDGVDYHVSADLTGQANHLGVTIEADIIKQKLPENNGGYNALIGASARPHKLVYDELTHRPPHRPHPLAGRQLLHGPRRPDQHRRRVQGRRATWPRPCAPRSSTSVPAAPASSRAARPSSGRWAKGVELLQRHPGRLPRLHRHRRLNSARTVVGTTRARRYSEQRGGWGGSRHNLLAYGRNKGVSGVRHRPSSTHPLPRSRDHPLRGRFGRRDAADRRPVHRLPAPCSETTWPRCPSTPPRSAPRGHGGGGLGVPGAHLRPRDHHTGRLAKRAGGHEPGRAAKRAAPPRVGWLDHRERRRLRPNGTCTRPATTRTHSKTTASSATASTRFR